MPKFKLFLLNILSVILFLIILGLCSLPTVFYYTAHDLERTNSTSTSDLVTNTTSPAPWWTMSSNTSCNKPLILSNGTWCVPQCSWKPWNKQQDWEIKGTAFTACLLAVLSFVTVLLTWFKIPQLWRFPHFVIVIMLAESTIIVILVSIGMLLGDDIFCSSKFLPVSSKTATSFCLFQGVVFHYLSGSISLWFVVYNVIIAKGLTTRTLIPGNQSSKQPFLLSALLCSLLPLAPVIYVLKSKDGYTSFYSTYCFPGSTELTYYTAILPVNILFAVGVTFLYFVILKLLKERNVTVTASREHEKHRKTKMDKVVIRLTMLMICYAVTLYLTYGSIAYILNKTPAYETATKLYFYCLMLQPDCSLDYTRYMFHIPLLLNYVSAAIFPVSTVVFLAANEKARRLWKSFFDRLRNFVMLKHEESQGTSVTHLVNEDERNRELVYGT